MENLFSFLSDHWVAKRKKKKKRKEKREKLMENLDYLSYVSLSQRKQSIYKQITWIFFFLWCHKFILHDINKRSSSIKTVHHFVLMMAPSLCDVLLSCIFLLLTSSSLYLSLEICIQEICLVFYLSIFYFFNNTYIVRSSLKIK